MGRDTWGDPTALRPQTSGDRRAVAVPVGVALLVLVTVALSAAVGTATLSATEAARAGGGPQGTVASEPPSGPTAAVVDLVVNTTGAAVFATATALYRSRVRSGSTGASREDEPIGTDTD